MSAIIYTLCAATAAVCAWMLLNGYRSQKYRLLLWSSLCFVGLTLNNLLLVLDKVVLPDIDLSLWRLSGALIAMTILLYGLILDVEWQQPFTTPFRRSSHGIVCSDAILLEVLASNAG